MSNYTSVYKRTKHDSPLRCPYCDKQFNMNGLNHRYGEIGKKVCKGCGKTFLYKNISAQYARKFNMKATWGFEEGDY